MHRSRGGGVVLLTRGLFEANVRVCSFGLRLDSLVCFCSPAPGAVSWWRTMSNVEAIDAALQAGVVNVEIPAVINRHSVHDARRHNSSLNRLRVDSHGRRGASRWGRRPVDNGIKGLDAREPQIRLWAGRVRNRRRRVWLCSRLVRNGAQLAWLLAVQRTAVGVPRTPPPRIVSGSAGRAVTSMRPCGA